MNARTSSALTALVVALAVAAAPVALADHWNADQSSPAAALGIDGGDDESGDSVGCAESDGGAEVYVQYLSGPGGFDVLTTDQGTVGVSGDTYYLCLTEDEDDEDFGLWKETNNFAHLQTEPAGGVDADTQCMSPGVGTISCAPTPAVDTPPLS